MIVVRSIHTAHALNSSIFRREAQAGAEAVRKQALDDFKRTTATWKHKPKFISSIEISDAKINILVGTSDKIYGYVDEGTKAHTIRARHKKGLIFLVGGKPKTTPHVVQAFPGKRGTDWRNQPKVRHPGTKARKFSEDIKKSLQPEFRKQMKNAIARFIRRNQ